MTTHFHACSLCEAGCGVVIETEGERVVSIRGDDADPFSKGYMCPKGSALADLHHDPDRLRRPVVRDGSTWREIEWDAAFDLVAARLGEIRDVHGRNAIAVYQGNPTAHNAGLLTYGQLFLRTLGTRNMYSATSNDQLPHMLAALLMFGNQVLMPVPDVDRTDLFVCLGANPLASNGSNHDRARHARPAARRAGARRARRRDRSAAHRDRRPRGPAPVRAPGHGRRAAARDRARRLRARRAERARAARAASPSCATRVGAWTPERAAAITGVAAADIRELARALCEDAARGAVRPIGVCTQEFGGLAAWLVYAVNAITGHLDEPGGLMFTTPAVDLVPLSKLLALDGGFARWRSRVSGKPEFGGELPMAAMAEEIETPGDGQIRALITSAGNPVLSTPGGGRLEQALPKLDFMVSIDPYVNETTRFAHVILPPASALERPHYDLALNLFAVRNVAKYSAPVFERRADARHDWEICVELWSRLGPPSKLPGGARLARAAAGKLGLEGLLDGALRVGPHRLSLGKLRAAPHGLDLGPLQPRLPKRLGTRDKRVQLAPAEYLADLPRLDARWRAAGAAGELVLIGRRQLRSNNSWLHNSQRLVKGPVRCTLLIHPEDAASRGIADGARARVATASGAIELPVEVTDAMMRGVVSIPHGWGHARDGVQLRVAATVPGASINDVLDPAHYDTLSGTSALTGQRVEVSPA